MGSGQLSIFDKETKKRYGRASYGGNTKGKRKLERPLSTKKSLHVVLKSDKARGKYSFLTPTNKLKVDRILKEKSKKFGVKILSLANVGNHLHLKIKISTRETFQKFLIATTALIAREITGARKGKPFGKFWSGLAFTRVINSRREELIIDGYITANQIESRTSPRVREQFRKAYSEWLKDCRSS